MVLKPQVLVVGALVVASCTKPEPITSTFVDNFERAAIGDNYNNTGGPYKIVNGQLNIRGAYNHPLWLKRKLPRNAIVEFDVTSKTKDGDIKVELWGDGETAAVNKGAYLASSYVFIFGGWGNKISAICRLDEHGNDRKERKDVRVETGKTYHWKIERRGNKIDWSIDGKPFLSFTDDTPLEGDRHGYLGFNNWQSDLYFDNLKVTPL